MENQNTSSTTSTFKEATHDIYIISTFILSFIFGAIGVAYNDDKFISSIFSVLMALSVGYCVNRYTGMFQNNKEIQSIAKYNVENLKSILDGMLQRAQHNHLSREEDQIIVRLCNMIRSWEEYYSINLNYLEGQYKRLLANQQNFTGSPDQKVYLDEQIRVAENMLLYLNNQSYTASSGSNVMNPQQFLQNNISPTQSSGSKPPE